MTATIPLKFSVICVAQMVSNRNNVLISQRATLEGFLQEVGQA